jgi:hypothetical protein
MRVKSEMKALGTRILLMTLFAQSAGCYQWIEVRPTELVKLNGSQDESGVWRPSDPNARLSRTDGSVFEVRRNADVRLETPRGTYDFTAPVVARVIEDDIRITAGNTGGTTLPLSAVKNAEVAKFDGDATGLAIVGGVLGLTLLSFLVVVGHSELTKAD